MGDNPLTDLDLLDMTAEQANQLIDDLTPVPTTPEREAALLAGLPPADPAAPIMVVSSLRLPLDLKRRIDKAAEAEGMSASVFIRTAIESALSGRDKTKLVNVDDVIRAIGSVPRAA